MFKNNKNKYSAGDLVRHTKRPEWGVGHITRVEPSTFAGKSSFRVTIRFEGCGLKVLNVPPAPIELDKVSTTSTCIDESAIDSIDSSSSQFGVDSSIKIKEFMVKLPDICTDPFRSKKERFISTLELFRFDNDPHGLLNWSRSQTMLSDPMTRFNRMELESFFNQWKSVRDLYFIDLATNIKNEPYFSELLAMSPKTAVCLLSSIK